MLSLLKHDLLLVKKHYKLAVLIAIFSFVVYSPIVASPYVLTGSILFYFATTFSLYYEDKYNFQRVLVSLPFNKRGLVVAKFISFFVMGAMATFFAVVTGSIIRLIEITPLDTWISLNDIYILSMMIILYTAVLLPLYYKFGYAKMRYYTIGLIMVTGMIFMRVYEQFLLIDTAWSRRLLEIVHSFDGILLQVGTVALLASLLFVSLTFSKRIISRKEY